MQQYPIEVELSAVESIKECACKCIEIKSVRKTFGESSEVDSDRDQE